jgi:hypothetical protein
MPNGTTTKPTWPGCASTPKVTRSPTIKASPMTWQARTYRQILQTYRQILPLGYRQILPGNFL